ncbi:MAG: hypothetical protein KDE51_18265, partial [Anaerolineales bacterium]|nr:hypothetical protein [Anaerolineales bacterium]
SGDFDPMIDSYGRVLFTQWDHLQTDQFADDNPVDFTSEAAGAPLEPTPFELFPEPRFTTDPNFNAHRFNHFFPWQIREDGTDGEVLNHLGRHELHDYFANNLNTDDNLIEFIAAVSGRVNQNSILNMFHIEEDPQQAGRYFGVDAPEFETHSAGHIFYLDAPPTKNADQVEVIFVTPPDPAVSGHYREPLPLSNGRLLAVHTAQTAPEATSGPSIYDFRLRWLEKGSNGYYAAQGDFVTAVPAKTIQYWDPDQLVTYTGQLWELNPVEVRPRPRPTAAPNTIAPPEQQMFTAAGVSVAELQAYLEANGLALVISRNVTTRDDLDRQQPFNLRVAGADTQTVGAEGAVYEVAFMQFFQGDLIRGYGSESNVSAGRRVLARPLHDPAALEANVPVIGPAGSVVIAADGSMAAFVPANRALSWQLTDTAGEAVVRERYWLTFQPGEIRTCASCHGLNETDQGGQTTPQNPPQALFDLLTFWKNNP